MKVLIVLIKLEGGVGGSNTEIAKQLRKKGNKVDFLSREDDLRIYSLFKSIFPLRKRIKQLIKEKDYDILYTQDYSIAFPLLFPYPLFWKKHFCCFCGIARYPMRKIFQYSTGIFMGKKLVVVSDELKNRFKKSKLVYRGVNFNKFKPLNKKRTNLGGLNRTYEKISKEELYKVSKEVGLNLTIAENIPRSKMNNFYNKCKVFVSLPKSGGFNNVWAEAMAAGVPIIIGNETGPGRKFPFDKLQKNKDKIKKITKIIKNPKKINYRKWLIDNKFTWEEKTEEIEDFLIKKINGK